MNTKYVLVWCSILLSVGIWLSKYTGISYFMGMGSSLFLWFLILLSYKYRKNGIVLICGAVFVCLAGIMRMELAQEAWRQQSHYLVGSEGTFYGVIAEEPLVVRGENGYVRYAMDLEQIRYADGEERNISGAAYLYDFSSDRKYQTGSAVAVSGELKAIRLYRNPGRIDLEGRYQSRNLIGRIYNKEPEKLRYMGETGKYGVVRWAESCRAGFKDSFSPYVDKIRLHMLMTLLFGGHYSDIPEEIIRSFSQTGMIHILSVSGSHVSLLFGFLYLLGKWIGLPEKVTAVPAILLTLFYGALAGFVPPVIRAVVMGILAVVGVLIHRDKVALNLLGAAVTGMLLWNPYFLQDISFQLSVCASAGILLFYGTFRKWLGHISVLPMWVREVCAMSVSAQLLTVPVVLYHFHALPLYFLLSNLAVAPLLEWVIISGLAAALFSLVLPPLSGGILYMSDYLLWAGIRLNMWISSLPHASVAIGGLTFPQAAAYYAGITVLYFRNGLKQKRIYKISAGAFLSAMAVMVAVSYVMRPETVLYVPDLGMDRGAILISKDRKIVYYKSNSLSSSVSEREFLSFLGYKGIFDADILILDRDAAKGAVLPSAMIPAQEIWISGDKTGPLHEETGGRNGNVRSFCQGTIRLKNGMNVLTNGSGWAIMDDDWGVYFAGSMLPEGTRPSHMVWVGGSHGFKPAVAFEELERIRPEAAVYTGRGKYSGEDTDAFHLYGCPVVQTEESGMVEVILTGQGWEIFSH